MRGSPPLHLVLFVAAFGLLAVPLAQLTFARVTPVAVMKEADTGAKLTPTHVRLRFAHVPLTASVKLDGRELLDAKPSQPAKASFEFDTKLTIPKEGIELLVSATWPQATPDTACTIELEPDGLDAQSQTRWSTGASMSEVINFEWKS